MSKAIRHLWIERKLYLIPRSTKDILMLINQVFLGNEDNNGLVTFDGKKFNVSNLDIFERFLNCWLMAVSAGESDPLITGENEIPVELQIAQEKASKPLKEFNHEKTQS